MDSVLEVLIQSHLKKTKNFHISTLIAYYINLQTNDD